MSTLSKQIVIAPQEVYVFSSTQGTDLGQLATTGDGRCFRYAKAGTATAVPGQVHQGPASDAVNYSPVGGLSIGQANATGSFGPFTVSNSLTVTANALAGGYMSVAVTPGQGYNYKIKSNSAVSAATGLSITLEDPLQTNLSTASRVTFIPNAYNGIGVVPIVPTAQVVGVGVSAIPPANFGWIQTRGVASVLIGGTPGSGQPVGVNLSNTTGAAALATGVVFEKVGQMTATGASGEYDLVDLSLD